MLVNVDKTKAMLITKPTIRQTLHAMPPFNAGNRQILFVRQICYQMSIDDEWTLNPEYKTV